MWQSKKNLKDVLTAPDFRIDAEYWNPIYDGVFKQGLNIINNFVSQKIKNIKSNPINKDFNYLEISRISLNSPEYKTIKVKIGEEPDRAHYILKKGDVAVSTVRPNRNAVALIKDNGTVASSGLTILRVKDNTIIPEYLWVYCKTKYFIHSLVRSNKASMYPAVSGNDVLNTPLHVPSVRFMSKIKSVIKHSQDCYLQSRELYSNSLNTLLKEIKLDDWNPLSNLTFLKNYSCVMNARRFDADYFLPKYDEVMDAIKKYSGGYVRLSDIASMSKCIEVGKDNYIEKGIPFIRVSNLNPFEITKEKFISELLYSENINHQPIQGEILLSKDGTPGIAYFLNHEVENMIPSSGILRLANNLEIITNESLWLILNSNLVKEQIDRDTGGSIISHWHPDQVNETILPILESNIQVQINEKITKSYNAMRKSKILVKYAQMAVETAIKHNETLALEYLENSTSGNG